MKVATKPQHSHPHQQEFALKADKFMIAKPKHEPSEAEMAACFSKLKDMVPTIPTDRKISKMSLLQHVIDYILDLELTLEHHPAVQQAAAPQLVQPSGERKPLAENTHLNTVCPTQASHLEKASEENGCCSRPASC